MNPIIGGYARGTKSLLRNFMLKLESIRTSYGQIEALSVIDLEVKKGEIVCLLGSNGAGKSTTLMTISGVLRPSGGRIIFEGQEIQGRAPHEIVRLGISHVPEGRKIFPRLTVRENLEMGAYIKDKFDEQLAGVFELFPVLKERHRQLGGTLSGGEQQMLAMGRALMSGPRVLLLDEPSLGLSPILVSKIFRTIKEINRQGMTVLLVEQNARAALGLASRGYVLSNGRVALRGTGQQLLENEEVKRAYLGGQN